MKIVLPILISLVVMIDFIKLNKTNKIVVFVYLSIVVLAATISTIDYFQLMKTNPLEAWISYMNPLTQWIELKLK